MAIQDRFKKANTIYKITKDLDLKGETLTIPAGCTLDFQGGSITNGVVTFSSTYLTGQVKLPLGVSGTIANDEYNVKWFGAKGDGIADDTAVLNWCFNNLSKVYIPNGTYNVTNIVITGDKYGIRWRGDLSYPNKYNAPSGSSVVFFHTGTGNIIEFKGNVGYCEIYNICLVTEANTTNAICFAKDKQATFFKTVGVNIWNNIETRVATGVSIGNGFAVTFENFNFRGLKLAIDIPQLTGSWFTETMLGSAYPSYIIDCDQAFNITRGRDVIIKNIMVERVGKVIDVISYDGGMTNVTMSNCYFEDYAKSGDYTFNMENKASNGASSLLIDNCTFLANKNSGKIFKSSGNLTLQNNRGLVINKNVVTGQFISMFNEGFYTAYRAYYNVEPEIGLFKVDWYNFTGVKNIDVANKFAMGYPTGDINYAQSVRVNRRFKVLASELAKGSVNIPVAYVPLDTICQGLIEINVKAFSTTMGNVYSAKAYNTTHRYHNMTVVKELNTFPTECSISRAFDSSNNMTYYYVTLPQVPSMAQDVYIEIEFYCTDGSVYIQPSWGSDAAVDYTKYIPSGWRMYDISKGWKKWNQATSTWTKLDGTALT